MKYNKKIFLCLMLIIISIISIIFINNKNTKKTFKYNRSTIALLVNGKVSNTFPSKGLYQIDITCDNANGVWDIDNWKLDIKNITGNVSCNISFDLNPSSLESIVNTTSTSGVASGDGLLYKSDYGVRYKGANPNNYIMFNGELYRIIGKLPVCLQSGCSSTQNRIKIIKEDSIGGLSFNANTTSSSVWETSTINLNLNNCFLGKLNSRENTTCANYCYSYYSSYKPVSKCDYTQNGISSSGDYYNMIEDVYYNIGVTSSTDVSGKTQYDKEVTSHTTSAYKIGLMYASDYGYAQNGSASKNYLFKNGYEWTMTAYSSSYPVYVDYYGGLYGYLNAYRGFAVRPVLYLKSNVYVVSGDGSEGNPYKIMLG